MASRASNILLIVITLLTLGSCKKNPFSNGEVITEERGLPGNITAFDIRDDISVIFVKSDFPHLEIKTGANLIEGITTTVTDNRLVLRNENKLNWMRPYDYPLEVTVFFNELNTINYESIGTVKSLDSIRGIAEISYDTIITLDSVLVFDTIIIDSLIIIDSSWHTEQHIHINEISRNFFYLNINGGSGDIDLLLSCDWSRTNYQFGTSKVTLRGKTVFNAVFNGSYGPIHSEELFSNYVYLQSRGYNDNFVWSTYEIDAALYGIGNLYYKGDPEIINCNDWGKLKRLE